MALPLTPLGVYKACRDLLLLLQDAVQSLLTSQLPCMQQLQGADPLPASLMCCRKLQTSNMCLCRRSEHEAGAVRTLQQWDSVGQSLRGTCTSKPDDLQHAAM